MGGSEGTSGKLGLPENVLGLPPTCQSRRRNGGCVLGEHHGILTPWLCRQIPGPKGIESGLPEKVTSLSGTTVVGKNRFWEKPVFPVAFLLRVPLGIACSGLGSGRPEPSQDAASSGCLIRLQALGSALPPTPHWLMQLSLLYSSKRI